MMLFFTDNTSGFKSSRTWEGQNLRVYSSVWSSRLESIDLPRLAKGKRFKNSFLVVEKQYIMLPWQPEMLCVQREIRRVFKSLEKRLHQSWFVGEWLFRATVTCMQA